MFSAPKHILAGMLIFTAILAATVTLRPSSSPSTASLSATMSAETNQTSTSIDGATIVAEGHLQPVRRIEVLVTSSM